MKTYIYPENLKAHASLWLWELKDIVVIGTGVILAVFLFAQFNMLIPFCLVALYAFLSMRFDDTSLLDYITYATLYFISSQQYFEWRLKPVGIFKKKEVKPYKIKPKGKRSTRQLMGIKTFGAFGLELYDKSELVLWSIAPSNLSVLSPVNVENKIRALTVVLSTVPELEFCCLDSSERFDANKQYLKSRIEQEKNPKVRELLAADFGFLDEIQIESSTAREFLVLARFRNQTPQQILGGISRVEKAIKDQNFEVRRAEKEEIQRVLAIHFEGNLAGGDNY